MITQVTIPVDAGSYTFPNANVFLQMVDGFAPPDPKIGHHEYTNAHGGITLSQYYKTRRVVFAGFFKGVDVPTFAQVRRDIENAFVFNNAEKLVKVVADDGLALQFNAIIAAAFQYKQDQGEVNGASFQVELDVTDPIFYAQSLKTASGGLVTITGGILLPALVPFTLNGALANTITLTNSGAAAAFPESVVLHGPGNNFVISNNTTGQDLFYTGTLGSSDSIVFDFRRRTALLNGTTNVYGNVSGSWWLIAKGTNTATLSVGSGSSGATLLTFNYRDTYWGA